MTTAGRLITADELMMMTEDGKRYELVRGTLVEKMPTGHPHAKVASKFDRALGNYTEAAGNYGEVVVGDPGYRLERDPDTVRAPDVAWIAPGRVSEGTQGYPELAPDLVVEVKSPNNSRHELAEKAAMWLHFGSRAVWVADPDTATITVYRPNVEPVTLGVDDTLDGDDLLPGFTCPVSYFFS